MRKKSDVDHCVRKRNGREAKRQGYWTCEWQGSTSKEMRMVRFLYTEILRVDREFEGCVEEVLADVFIEGELNAPRLEQTEDLW